MMVGMQSSPAVRFLAIARGVASAAREQGLRSPTFRSPPRAPGVQRSIRRWPGGATVAVVTRDRPAAAILNDCIEGVVVANDLTGRDAVRARTALWAALTDHPAAAA